MVQLALVGCAHIHTPGFVDRLLKRESVRVKSVFDADPRRARFRAEQLQAKTVTDLNEIIQDDSISGVIVCSETDAHETIVTPLAQAGKHLFVEKPLGLAADDAFRMSRQIADAGVLFQTGYFMRGNPAVLKIRDMLAAGIFGKVSRVRASNCHWGSIGGWFDARPDKPHEDWRWMADPKRAGVGAFGDLGTHVLDLLLWLFGPIKTVYCEIDLVTERYPDCDEAGEALIRFESGTIGTLAAGWVDHANPVLLQVSGTDAHAAIIDGKLHVKSPKHKLDGIIEDLPAAWPHAFDLFLDALEGKKVELVSAAEAADRSAAMEAMYQAAKSREKVTPRRA